MTLHDIIENIWLETQDIDSIFRNKKRYMIVKYAKEGLKELQMTFATHINAMNFKVPPSCRVYKPNGYERFLRAYLLDCEGNKIELKKNNDIPAEIYRYILNCDGTILSDGCGIEFKDNCLECNQPLKSDCVECCSSCGSQNHLPCEVKELFHSLETYKNSWIATNDRLDYFEFSPDLEDLAIVIEYLSNNTIGVEECQIVVDEELSSALEYYIKFKLLENGLETVPQSRYFKQQFKAKRDKALSKNNALTKTDLYSLFINK